MISQAKPLKLTLYVAGQTPKSIAAIRNLERLVADSLPGAYEVEVVDLRSASTLRSSAENWLSSACCQ